MLLRSSRKATEITILNHIYGRNPRNQENDAGVLTCKPKPPSQCFFPMGQKLFYFYGVGKFCLVHGLRQPRHTRHKNRPEFFFFFFF